MKISLSSTNLLFRGRKTTQKIRLTMTLTFFHSKSHLGSYHLPFHHHASFQILLCREKLLLTDLFRYIEEGYSLILLSCKPKNPNQSKLMNFLIHLYLFLTLISQLLLEKEQENALRIPYIL